MKEMIIELFSVSINKILFSPEMSDR